MKTKIFFKNFQIHAVPLETVIFDESGNFGSCILLNDVNEKRWKIIFKAYQALKITPIDYANLNFMKGGDFHDDCFVDMGSNDVFRSFVMEVQDSKWIKELKRSLRKDTESLESIDKARHFLIPCYDNIIEIIAWDLELTEYKE